MRADLELTPEEALSRLISNRLATLLTIKTRSLIGNLAGSFTLEKKVIDENTLLATQIQLLLSQLSLTEYLAQNNQLQFFITTLKTITRALNAQTLMAENHTNPTHPNQFDSKFSLVLANLKKSVDDHTQFIQADYRKLFPFIGILPDSVEPLRKQVLEAEDLDELAKIVRENRANNHKIAGILISDELIFTIRFMHFDSPLFFDVMAELPEAFQAYTNLLMEKSVIRKHTDNYNLDPFYIELSKKYNISLINHYKFLLEAQDPVFFYLDTPKFSRLSVEREISNIKTAIENIKKDKRFIHSGSKDHINQAGIDLTHHLQERLSELNEKLPTFSNKMKAVFAHLKMDFLAVYGFTGYVVTEHRATAEIERRPYKGTIFPWGLLIASVLGLPTRPAHFTRHDSLRKKRLSDVDIEPNYEPNFSFLQLLRGFIGGWVPIRDRPDWKWTLKKKWQIILLPLKLFIILPLNIIAVPCRLLSNIIKFFSEFLATVAVDGLRTAYKNLFHLAKVVFDYERAAHLNIFPAVLLVLASFCVLLIFVLMNIVKKIGFALSSPDKSARMAFNYGRKFILGLKESESNEDLAFAVGVILAFVSILTTTISWAILLPVTLSALFTYIPALSTVLTALLQLPLISGSFIAFQNTLLSIGAFLGTGITFAPFVSSLAAFVGVNVSATLLLACSAFAFVAAPFGAIISRIIEDCANAWARWGHTPLKTVELPSSPQKLGNKTGKEVVALVEAAQLHLIAASNSGKNTDQRGDVELSEAWHSVGELPPSKPTIFDVQNTYSTPTIIGQ